ncbi:hypothetical protein PLESTF_001450100, partial [Pleodorina starrii]
MTKSCGREQHQRHHHHHHHHQGQHQCQHHNHHQCQYQRQQQQQQGQCQQQQQRQHQQRHRRPPRPSAAVTLLLALLLSSCGGRAPWSLAAGQSTTSSSSSNVKWTFLVYMLADNNLECFGILDLIEMMVGMSKEPAGCSSSSCGAGCPAGYTATTTSSCGTGQFVSRCCPSSDYPDVLVLADRGVSSCPSSAPSGYPSLDTSLLASTWTSAKELLVLPGGSLQQVRDLGEIDMASPDQLAAFLQRAFARFPPTGTSSGTSSSVTRKYVLVLWDHGNGWK